MAANKRRKLLLHAKRVHHYRPGQNPEKRSPEILPTAFQIEELQVLTLTLQPKLRRANPNRSSKGIRHVRQEGEQIRQLRKNSRRRVQRKIHLQAQVPNGSPAICMLKLSLPQHNTIITPLLTSPKSAIACHFYVCISSTFNLAFMDSM